MLSLAVRGKLVSWSQASACMVHNLRASQGQGHMSTTAGSHNFDIRLLDFLVCPLSKAPLRWDAATSELVCDELGVAYPVRNGMPNLRPADGRVLEVGDKEVDPSGQPWGDDADSKQPSFTSPH